MFKSSCLAILEVPYGWVVKTTASRPGGHGFKLQSNGTSGVCTSVQVRWYLNQTYNHLFSKTYLPKEVFYNNFCDIVWHWVHPELKVKLHHYLVYLYHVVLACLHHMPVQYFIFKADMTSLMHWVTFMWKVHANSLWFVIQYSMSERLIIHWYIHLVSKAEWCYCTAKWK